MTLNSSSPHVSNARPLSNMMLLVLIALIPGALTWIYFFGISLLITLLIAVPTAITFEALTLKLRGRPVKLFLQDYSAVVTAVLLAICLPTYAPWWMIVIATGFAIVIAKHLYGGLGQNPFNPAMIGYVVILISFPATMNQWTTVSHEHRFSVSKAINLQLGSTTEANKKWFDSVSSATPLNLSQGDLDRGHTLTEIYHHQPFARMFGGNIGAGWQWINFMFLLGGIALIMLRVIQWHIPLAMLASIAIISFLFHVSDSDLYHSPLLHLFSGGTMFAAFFIATDPVTACTTPKGKIIFGIGVGLFTWLIRTWGGYPDGIAFAVLLMNMAAPTIDYFTQPRVFGHQQGPK
ncbi:Electron transport complex protein RnfD [hydrothermal vent metagenome]|uniref:Electron transport complex protein RnfD n=1 Tax=hydrothermal vent metagenome TaxID=652676 RepID=A0A3B0YNB9_9ZZZZ